MRRPLSNEESARGCLGCIGGKQLAFVIGGFIAGIPIKQPGFNGK